LGQMDPSLREDQAVLKVAEEVGRTPAQVLLR
jgi:diketogulonate reductase-like aldo/keto reductase